MKPRQICKITVDVVMTILLIILMAYQIIGQFAHEWTVMAMLAVMVSGIRLSRYVVPFHPNFFSAALARLLHLAASYWSFVLMSVHLGLHWGMVLGMIRRGNRP